MSFAGRRMKREYAGTRFHRRNMVTALFRLSPSLLLIPCWEANAPIPKRTKASRRHQMPVLEEA